MLITRHQDGTFHLRLTAAEASDLAHFVFTHHDGDKMAEMWPDTYLIANMMDEVHVAQTGASMDGVIETEEEDDEN